MNRHNREPLAMGEKPITYKDAGRYEDVVTKPDNIFPGSHPGSIVYEKRYPEGTVFIVEQVKGNKLAFQTMYKSAAPEKIRPALMGTLPSKPKGEKTEQPEENRLHDE